MSISSHTALDIGTEVRVGNKFGKIVKVEFVNAIPCGKVVLHTIEFHSKRIRKFGQTYKIEHIKPQISKVNYSFIEVI